MKKIFKFLSTIISIFLLCISFSSTMVLANDNANRLKDDTSELAEGDGQVWGDYRIDLGVRAGLAKGYTQWKIEWPMYESGFRIAPAGDLNEWNLDTKTTFIIRDSNDNITFNRTYDSGYRMKNIQTDLSKVALHYNYSFQIIPEKWQTVVRIHGYIDNNFDNHDYSVGIDNSRGSHVKFKLNPTGLLKVERITPKGLSILNNRFGIETSHLGIDKGITDLKFYKAGNGYKLTRADTIEDGIKVIKHPFYIVGYNTYNGNLMGQKFSKQIPAGINMKRFDELLAEVPTLKMGEAIQFIAAPKDFTGEPKVYIKGGVINNYDFSDPANGMNNYESSRKAFHLTDRGLVLDPMTMK